LLSAVFAVLALAGAAAVVILYWGDPDLSAGTIVDSAYRFFGIYLFVTALFSVLVFNRSLRMRREMNLGETGLLRGLNSLPWSIAALFLSNPVSGLLLLFAYRPINRVATPVAWDPKSGVVLAISHLTKLFPVRRSFYQLVSSKTDMVHAVDDVSFEVKKAQVFGLAGESGSGKTTILRTALMLTPPTSGSVVFNGMDIARLTGKEMKRVRTKLQVVFQDPYESMNPRMSVFEVIAEGLFVNKLVSSKDEAVLKVSNALRDVQLIPPEEYLHRFPHELSGGQRQRVAVARALVLEPELILADEPVSMLDVSVRAEVVNVLLAARERKQISVVIVTHDLALSKDVVDYLAIMYLGKIVEEGPAQDVVGSPYHPYTQALVAAVPVPDPTAPQVRVLAKGEIPTNISPPSGCRFHPRCAFAKQICADVEPPLSAVVPGRKVACHFWAEANEAFLKGAALSTATGLET